MGLMNKIKIYVYYMCLIISDYYKIKSGLFKFKNYFNTISLNI